MGQVTIGGAQFDIIGTVIEATTYLSARIGSTWATATDDQKAQSLVTATRLLADFITTKNISLPEGLTFGTIDDVNLSAADYELAYALFLDPDVADLANQNTNISQLSAGSGTSISYFRPTLGPRFPIVTQQKLNLWITSVTGAAGPVAALVSGECGHSVLDRNRFGLNNGFG